MPKVVVVLIFSFGGTCHHKSCRNRFWIGCHYPKCPSLLLCDASRHEPGVYTLDRGLCKDGDEFHVGCQQLEMRDVRWCTICGLTSFRNPDASCFVRIRMGVGISLFDDQRCVDCFAKNGNFKNMNLFLLRPGPYPHL
jgi:hypothetical protein